MRRTIGKMLLVAGLCLGAPAAFAQADELARTIVRQLSGQGFETITLSKTWLGRTRIMAVDGTLRREIILNERTGEILRDYWERSGPGEHSPQIVTAAPGRRPTAGSGAAPSGDTGTAAVAAGEDLDQGETGTAVAAETGEDVSTESETETAEAEGEGEAESGRAAGAAGPDSDDGGQDVEGEGPDIDG